MNRTRGFTLIELLTVMAIIALLVGLLLPALAQARAKAQMTKDQTQIKQIHMAWTTFGRDFDGIFPTPGLINRLPDPVLGDKPGRGPEDVLANNSASMYSACIMQNYFTPQILVAPTEPSGFVAIKDDFNWSVYDPLNDIYWDAESDGSPPPDNEDYIPFATRLDKQLHPISDLLCNTSYAHMPIAGDRKTKEWRDTLNSQWAIIGNRGVREGLEDDEEEYYGSVTLEFHGGRRQWVGNIGFNDNHVELMQTFYPEGINYLDDDQGGGGGTATLPDNIFRNDTGDNQTSGTGHDIWLTLVSEIENEDLDLKAEWD